MFRRVYLFQLLFWVSQKYGVLTFKAKFHFDNWMKF